jgi:hypothetical protein
LMQERGLWPIEENTTPFLVLPSLTEDGQISSE